MKQSRMAIFAISMSVFSLATVAFADDTLETKSEIKTAAPYPTALIERPFTLPAGTAEVSAGMKFGNFFPKTGNVGTDMASVNGIGLNFGITDDFQAGVRWGGFQIPKGKPEQSLSLNMGYFVGATDWSATMVSLEVPLHFNKYVVKNVSLAAPTAFNVGVKNLSILAFYDGLVDFSFHRGKYEASFNVPVKVTYQATPSLALGVSTSLAKFHAGSSLAHNYIWKSAPVKLHGLYAITNEFDVVAETGFDDVTKAKDSFAFSLGLNYRIGILS